VQKLGARGYASKFTCHTWLFCCMYCAVYSRMRIAVSQLDGSKTTLNNSASWIIDSWQGRVSSSAVTAC
jgi:hypothetical protein